MITAKIADNGYRYYSENEVNRLQEILFYRNLDFSLKEIRLLLENNRSRLEFLEEQHNMLQVKKQKLDIIIDTLIKSIEFEQGTINVKSEEKFIGLEEKNKIIRQKIFQAPMISLIFLTIILAYSLLCFIGYAMGIGQIKEVTLIGNHQIHSLIVWSFIFILSSALVASIVLIFFNRKQSYKTVDNLNDMYTNPAGIEPSAVTTKRVKWLFGENFKSEILYIDKIVEYEFICFDENLIKNEGMKVAHEAYTCICTDERLIIKNNTPLSVEEVVSPILFNVEYSQIKKFIIGLDKLIAFTRGTFFSESYFWTNTIVTEDNEIKIRNGLFNLANLDNLQKVAKIHNIELVDRNRLLEYLEIPNNQIRYDAIVEEYTEILKVNDRS